MAINALGDVDAAINNCMVTGNWEGIGNLIKAKDELIGALNNINDKSNKFSDASKAGLSGDDAMYVAENTGDGSLQGAIARVQARRDGRVRPDWSNLSE